MHPPIPDCIIIWPDPCLVVKWSIARSNADGPRMISSYVGICTIPMLPVAQPPQPSHWIFMTWLMRNGRSLVRVRESVHTSGVSADIDVAELSFFFILCAAIWRNFLCIIKSKPFSFCLRFFLLFRILDQLRFYRLSSENFPRLRSVITVYKKLLNVTLYVLEEMIASRENVLIPETLMMRI